jgi:hypothetical protein
VGMSDVRSISTLVIAATSDIPSIMKLVITSPSDVRSIAKLVITSPSDVRSIAKLVVAPAGEGGTRTKLAAAGPSLRRPPRRPVPAPTKAAHRDPSLEGREACATRRGAGRSALRASDVRLLAFRLVRMHPTPPRRGASSTRSARIVLVGPLCTGVLRRIRLMALLKHQVMSSYLPSVRRCVRCPWTDAPRVDRKQGQRSHLIRARVRGWGYLLSTTVGIRATTQPFTYKFDIAHEHRAVGKGKVDMAGAGVGRPKQQRAVLRNRSSGANSAKASSSATAHRCRVG